MNHVDGNALAGALAIAFGRDMTNAVGVCDSCGDRHALAQTHVYLRCPGMVMRCPKCANVEVVLVEIEHHMKVTLRGLSTIDLQ
jgi:hypothetical protein